MGEEVRSSMLLRSSRVLRDSLRTKLLRPRTDGIYTHGRMHGTRCFCRTACSSYSAGIFVEIRPDPVHSTRTARASARLLHESTPPFSLRRGCNRPGIRALTVSPLVFTSRVNDVCITVMCFLIRLSVQKSDCGRIVPTAAKTMSKLVSGRFGLDP